MERLLTMNQDGRVLLWVDDDGRERFLYEEHLLSRRGWVIQWAKSVREAIDKLQGACFDAVLLDQMLPLEPGALDSTDVWSGCLLLYWLRGMPGPSSAPPALEAFHDDEVTAAIKAAGSAVPMVSKPIDAEKLLPILGERI
jgi:CheY-like chemotaxis protein